MPMPHAARARCPQFAAPRTDRLNVGEEKHKTKAQQVRRRVGQALQPLPGFPHLVRNMRGKAQGPATEYVQRVVDLVLPGSWAHHSVTSDFRNDAACRESVRESLDHGSQRTPQTIDVCTGENEDVFARIRAYAAACCAKCKKQGQLHYVRLTVL